MKIAITGASGHIAASVIPLLINKGHSLRALVYNQLPKNTSPAIEIVKGNLSDASALKQLVKGCDLVIHAAAKISINSNRDPSVYKTNVGGTKTLFQIAQKAGVKKFIYIGSIHAYQQQPADKELDETSPYCSHASARYDQSKRDAQQYVLQHASAEMEVIVLNPTAVVGPDDFKPSLLGQAIIDIYQRNVPALMHGGFDFCDVRDVAQAIVSAIDRGRTGQNYLLPGKYYTLDDLQTIIFKIKGETKKIPIIPSWAAYAGLPFIQWISYLSKKEPLYTKESLTTLFHGNKKINGAKARQELGYQTRPLEATIQDTLEWFIKNGYLKLNA